jgi:hypothetical protein
MNHRRYELFFLLVSAFFAVSSFVAAGNGETVLPFPVTLGGQKAVLEKPTDSHAKVAQPVVSNAELVVDTKESMVIVNIFDCDAKGDVAQAGSGPLIVLMQGTNKSPISKTLDGNVPKPGYHIMNIVAGGATARVFFTVK